MINYPLWEQFPLLLIELSGPKQDVGFVAAGFVRIRRMHGSSVDSPHGRSLDLLLSMNKPTHPGTWRQRLARNEP